MKECFTTGATIEGFVTLYPQLTTLCVSCAPVEDYYQLDKSVQDSVSMWSPMWSSDDFAKGAICANCASVIIK